jgi:hypothetical protein
MSGREIKEAGTYTGLQVDLERKTSEAGRLRKSFLQCKNQIDRQFAATAIYSPEVQINDRDGQRWCPSLFTHPHYRKKAYLVLIVVLIFLYGLKYSSA